MFLPSRCLSLSLRSHARPVLISQQSLKLANAARVHCCLLVCSFTRRPLNYTICNCLLSVEPSHFETQLEIAGPMLCGLTGQQDKCFLGKRASLLTVMSQSVASESERKDGERGKVARREERKVKKEDQNKIKGKRNVQVKLKVMNRLWWWDDTGAFKNPVRAKKQGSGHDIIIISLFH